MSWHAAAHSHGWVTLTGLVWETLAVATHGEFALWMLPITLPMIFSIPLNVLLSSSAAGDRLRRAGLLQTPEEADPPRELRDVEAAEARLRTRLGSMGASAVVQAIADPAVNALHGELQLQPYAAAQRNHGTGEDIVERLLREGPAALGRDRLFALLLDGAACRRAHLQLWHTPEPELAPVWQAAIAAYAPHSRPPLLEEA
jgi:membrane glycosyltransferase